MTKDKVFLLVAGSRSIKDKDIVFKIIFRYIKENGWKRDDIAGMIVGAAPGIDTLAEEFARRHGIQPIILPALWDYYKKPAGFIRNSNMVDLATHVLLIRENDSPGTGHTLSLVSQKKIPYKLVTYNRVSDESNSD